MEFPPKLKDILTSRRFWATISALALIWVSFSQRAIDVSTAIQGTIAAVAAYVIAVGLEDNGKEQAG